MRTAFTLLFLGAALITSAQECAIKIEILPNQFMVGSATPAKTPVKKMEVKFSEEVMEVLMPVNNKTYLISVVNENCQAYCKRDKRVRQLNSGDEKLVKNLFEQRRGDIENQISICKPVGLTKDL